MCWISWGWLRLRASTSYLFMLQVNNYRGLENLGQGLLAYPTAFPPENMKTPYLESNRLSTRSRQDHDQRRMCAEDVETDAKLQLTIPFLELCSVIMRDVEVGLALQPIPSVQQLPSEAPYRRMQLKLP